MFGSFADFLLVIVGQRVCFCLFVCLDVFSNFLFESTVVEVTDETLEGNYNDAFLAMIVTFFLFPFLSFYFLLYSLKKYCIQKIFRFPIFYGFIVFCSEYDLAVFGNTLFSFCLLHKLFAHSNSMANAQNSAKLNI